jgi:purine nucleosidase
MTSQSLTRNLFASLRDFATSRSPHFGTLAPLDIRPSPCTTDPVHRIPVLLDTDIGTNVDDALALLYLLRQPRCDLLGVTTVSGDVRKRAGCAGAICRAAGRDDVPVHCGAPGPLLTGPGQAAVPLYDSLAAAGTLTGGDQPRPVGAAVEFLRQTIRGRPGEISLLTIGPLTNIALLFALDPEIPSLLRSIVSMAGVYFPHEKPVETNVRIDPVAAAMVLRATAREDAAPHTLVGLNVTTRCVLPADDLRKRLRPPLPPADLVLAMLDAWAKRTRQVTFHDPLAAALVFEESLCAYEAGVAMNDVTRPGDEAGRTFFAPAKQLPDAPRAFGQRVAKGVKVRPFFDHYFATVSDTLVSAGPPGAGGGRYLPPPPGL